MDRHDVSEAVTAEIVAHIHQEDLKIQDHFGCRGLTYWFDEKRKTAFCLIEAPDKKSIQEMHNQAHGEVPHQLIEVDSQIVESFLGRIEDPVKAKNTSLNIINDPAFRTIMVATFQLETLQKNAANKGDSSRYDSFVSISKIISDYNGRIVNHIDDRILASFESVTKACLCAKSLQLLNENSGSEKRNATFNIKIGLNAGAPVTGKESIFQDTIKLAERMEYVFNSEIVVSGEVMDLYKSENANQFIDNESVFVLSLSDEIFLNSLMDFIECEWKNTNLKVDDFANTMGFSKSQLYRKMMQIVGESPNSFLMTFRLKKSLELLKKQNKSVSEIAFDSGFSSPSYFSKCFNKKYHFSPSEYFQRKN
jgi:AraC-like DNA-binding protein